MTLVLLSVFAAAVLYHPAPLAVPIAVLVVAFVVADLRRGLYACAALIALSTEVSLGSVGLDFPSEPLMLLLAAATLVYVLTRAHRIEAAHLLHPISLLLMLHLGWILLTAFAATTPSIAFKFFAAKLWYVLPFYVLAGLLIRREVDLLQLVRWLAVPMVVVLTYCIVRHAQLGFSFELVNKAMYPFFRNHVTYASLSATLFPLFVLAVLQEPRGSFWRKLNVLASLLCLVAVNTSFTRAAVVSLVFGVVFIGIMHWRLTKVSLVLGALLIVGVSTLLVSNNRFFGFTPDYNKTVTHTDFSNLLDATFKLEDISLMERVYRWVAGSYMVPEHPWLGWGPGNFYSHYQGYALESFRTYVSDNPEHSGIHNYLLMTLVEQGHPGLLIFFLLCAAGLLTAQFAYTQAATPARRRAAGAIGACLAINLSFQLINDMLETDKSGPWFFLCLTLLVVLHSEARLKSNWTAEPTLGNQDHVSGGLRASK